MQCSKELAIKSEQQIINFVNKAWSSEVCYKFHWKIPEYLSFKGELVYMCEKKANGLRIRNKYSWHGNH